ncbi:MAG: hypothetical protein KF764_21300 [Labilithrix sp.]|nr:hypothetical protein [Labilithrix sp.]
MKPTTAAFVAVATLAALAACAEAGGELQGGELSDAGAGATVALIPDTGGPAEAECVGTGTRWSDLYDDIFGPTGRGGSCVFSGNCHGPDGAGARTPSGVECFDRKGCRESFFATGLVSESDSSAPASSILLLGTLRVRRGDAIAGFMPEAPADYVFSEACIKRIETWIRDGAKDD